jgi:hypothetical protein
MGSILRIPPPRRHPPGVLRLRADLSFSLAGEAAPITLRVPVPRVPVDPAAPVECRAAPRPASQPHSRRCSLRAMVSHIFRHDVRLSRFSSYLKIRFSISFSWITIRRVCLWRYSLVLQGSARLTKQPLRYRPSATCDL